ncbi:unnamed protein product [Sphenostylis stenocarpa]|uniref:Uncharacterized protein n=1 Tax=Sphenostylis stenocarpa TaxID=92480 RepID=A0AA86W0D1_9FABA|nr:unnamed protein product [Sphenostylis stenocarpa]
MLNVVGCVDGSFLWKTLILIASVENQKRDKIKVYNKCAGPYRNSFFKTSLWEQYFVVVTCDDGRLQNLQ